MQQNQYKNDNRGYRIMKFLITRELIEKYQPLLCIGGHIHEHFDKDRVNQTVCINAGYGKDANILIE